MSQRQALQIVKKIDTIQKKGDQGNVLTSSDPVPNVKVTTVAGFP